MTIETYLPRGPLEEFVEYIGFISGKESGTGIAFPRMHQVIIINLGTHFSSSGVYTPTAARETSTAVWINGKQDDPFLLENYGTTAMYAIGLKLGMLPYFAGLPALETNNTTLSAEHWTSRDVFFLREQLSECTSVNEGFLLIEKYLLNLLKGKDFTGLDRIKWLSQAMYTHSVEEIGSYLGMTRKRMSSEAHHYFGGPIKNIQGIIRLNKTLATIANVATGRLDHIHTSRVGSYTSPTSTLSSLHEYFDQSHFIHDFKARTGITPLQYKRLVQQFPFIAQTPNFIALPRETFLQFISNTPR
ncbi:MAG: hypothetical protein JST68_01255 [Bacteroidetes bacterium]|nr:hypothetical protein [Bacteroidota bacterium]